MCGIAGFVAGEKEKDRLIRKMTDAIGHRGPDDHGYFVDDEVAFGHRRLSIIDLASGAQPMRDGNLVIIFNGEIYNYLELRKALEKKGHIFQTNSDTEVILKMYREFGVDAPKKMNGMFSFAIWDCRKKTMFAARDHLGIKPFYYSFQNRELVFASEIKALLLYPKILRKLNTSVLNSYFQYRYIPGRETFFQNIFSLQPGHLLKFDFEKGELMISKYWELEAAENKPDRGEEYYQRQVFDEVQKSIKSHMMSEVPIGAYLSGGLDSSIVAAVMAKECAPKKLHTFTIGFPEKGFNEFEFGRMVAEMWHTDHHEILLDSTDYFRHMEELIGFKDAPLSVPNEVPLYLMSRELKKYITVVLSGEGADELFGGYGRIFIAYLFYDAERDGDFLDYFLKKYNYVADEELDEILSPEIMREIEARSYSRQLFQDCYEKVRKADIRDRIPFIFQNLHLPGLLARLDTTTMAASVEGRVPFVNFELVEKINQLPFDYKICWKSEMDSEKALMAGLSAAEISEKHDTTKYILRKAFSALLPEPVVERKKIGFPVPLDNWFQGGLKQYAREVLFDKKTLDRGIFNSEALKQDDFFDKLSGMKIWMMINFELFARKYFD